MVRGRLSGVVMWIVDDEVVYCSVAIRLYGRLGLVRKYLMNSRKFDKAIHDDRFLMAVFLSVESFLVTI